MDKDKRLNVFNQSYMPLTHISNWPRNIRLFFRQFKWAYQRATRGCCDCDVWDLDSYFLDLFHDTLLHLANTTHGYPGTKEFSTPESWDRCLRELAQKFYQANEYNDFYPTPKESIWWEAVKDKDFVKNHEWTDPNPEYSKEMIEEANINYESRQTVFQEAWEQMGHIFHHLWD